MTHRILHLIQSLGGGGAERQLSYLARDLAAIGEDVHVSYVTAGINLETLRGSACAVHQLPRYGNHDPRLLFAIRRQIRVLRPDLVQTWLPQMDVLGGLAAMSRKVPYILSERNTARAYRKNLKSTMRRFVGSHASAIVANSNQGLGYWDFTRSTVVKTVIQNGLPIEELEHYAGRRSGATADRTPLILFAGRYMPAKNAELVLDAFIEVARRRRDARFEMYGEGILDHALRQRVRAAGLEDRIGVRGYIDNLWDRIAAASVLVSLSVNEGQPNVVLEAAAIGCPLILSDIPAHKEILQDHQASYVRSLEPMACAEVILDVLDRPEQVSGQTAAARRVVQGLNTGKSASAYKALYEAVLSGS